MPKTKPKITPLGCLFLVLLIGGLAVILKFTMPPGSDSTDELLAYAAAKDYVRDALGPLRASASFPFLPEVVLNLGNGRWKFSSTVDYNNQFVAKLQARWTVVVQRREVAGRIKPDFDLEDIAVYD